MFCSASLLHYQSSFSACQLSALVRLKEVYPELLDAVADRISLEYVQLGLELGIPFDRIKQIRMNHRTNTLEIVRQILREWYVMSQPKQKATIGRLATALLNTGSGIKTLVEYEDRIIAASQQPSVPEESSQKCHILWLKCHILWYIVMNGTYLSKIVVANNQLQSIVNNKISWRNIVSFFYKIRFNKIVAVGETKGKELVRGCVYIYNTLIHDYRYYIRKRHGNERRTVPFIPLHKSH